MGIDLKLLPIEHQHGDFGYAHTVLTLERHSDLWEVIWELRMQPVPRDFSSFFGPTCERGESHYGRMTEDAYGEDLRSVAVKELLKISDHEGVRDYAEKNAAAWAYLAELDPEDRVVLYWC